MKKKILFVGEYLLSFPGGAERSIWEELKKYSKKYDVEAITFDSYHKTGDFNEEGIKVTNFHLNYTLKESRFFEIFLNRRYIYNILKNINSKKYVFVITQSLMAPLISNWCIENNSDYHYYIRDEGNANTFNNYEVGIRKILKDVKDVLQYVIIRKYIKENTRAILHAKVLVSNSKFIANLLLEKYGRKSQVVYPYVNKKSFEGFKKNKNSKYILFLGAGMALKGYDIAKKIAAEMPGESFKFVGRVPERKQKGNILYASWEQDIQKLYENVKLVIVPSKVNEAYGRVVVEAQLLGIPAICSSMGGLPEAINNKKLLVKNNEDISEWLHLIKKVLK